MPFCRSKILNTLPNAVVVEISEFEPLKKSAKAIELRHVQHDRRDYARGQETAERLAAFEQIFRFHAVRRGTVKRRLGDDVVADRNVEALAEFAQLLLVHFLLLVRNVLALAGLAESVALDRLGQNHRRLALVLRGGLVGGIDLARVVAAAQQLADLLVGEMIHQFEQFGIFAEEMFARVAARLDDDISDNRRPRIPPCA